MANVRCPMCSKLNPPEAEVCAFCGARLKPVLPSSEPAQPPSDEPEDAPDWLRQLRSDEPGVDNETSKPAESAGQPAEDAEIPDWLARIREHAQPENEGEIDLSAQAEDEAPDWMKELRDQAPGELPADDDWLAHFNEGESQPAGGSTPPAADSLAPDPGSAETPDWLRDLSAGAPAEPAAPSGEPAQFTASDDDWMKNLSGWQPDQPAAAPVEPAPQGTGDAPAGEGQDDFAWLDNLAAPGEPPAAPEGGSGWGITDLNEPSSDQPVSTGDFVEDSFPGWEQGAAPEPGAGLPNWLQDEDKAQPAGSDAEGTALPTWLADETTGPAQITPESDAEAPDWLAGFAQADRAAETANESQSDLPADAAGLPTWLAADTEPSQPAEPSPAGEPSGLDWLAGFEEAGTPSAQPEAEAKLPEQPLESEALTPAAFDLPAEQPAADAEPEAGETVPDWLREFQSAAPAPADEFVSPLVSGDEPPAVPAIEGDQPFMVDLPDWLDEDQAVKAAEAGDQPGEPGGDLAAAELPEWVKEMRPIESIIPGEAPTSETDQRVERAGPLAGMRGVIPAEDLSTRYRKPPVYSAKLRVTEKQRSQASMFDSLLAEEVQPLKLPVKRPSASAALLRVLIGLVLLAALALPMLPGMNFDALVMPVLAPPDMQNMFNQIDSGQAPDAPVLLAVDYEPALSGEMRLAASALVDQLVARDARIVVVSTVPTGPALAGQLLGSAIQAHAQYDPGARTINLGYLPGGTTSLLAFARQPQVTAPAWQNSFLKDTPGLAGFGQIILLTDRAETGRAWVEQVQPAIGKVPLYIVASAQAAPLLEPYVSSGQVAGMVRGMLGGVLYARLAGQTDSPAVGYLSAYQIGLALAFAIVLVGAVISGGVSLVKRDDKDEV